MIPIRKQHELLICVSPTPTTDNHSINRIFGPYEWARKGITFLKEEALNQIMVIIHTQVSREN